MMELTYGCYLVGEKSISNSSSPAGESSSTGYSSSENLNVLDEIGRINISSTIDVNGTTWDGSGKVIYANGMGDGSQSENQDPIFNVTNGTVTNVTIGFPACDGIHLMGGNCTVSNIVIPDVGEDALTVKKPGTYVVSNFTAHNSEDKLFQINDLCTITYQNIVGNGMGKFCRQNGGKTWKCVIYINGIDINGVDEAVVRSDSTLTTVYYRNISCNLSSSDWWYGNFTVSSY